MQHVFPCIHEMPLDMITPHPPLLTVAFYFYDEHARKKSILHSTATLISPYKQIQINICDDTKLSVYHLLYSAIARFTWDSLKVMSELSVWGVLVSLSLINSSLQGNFRSIFKYLDISM